MNKRNILGVVALVGSLGVTTPLLAHHAVNAQFDVSTEIDLTGVLTRLDNIAPHSRWEMDITNAQGQVEQWRFESASPALLRRQGLRVREDLVVGNTYTVHVNPSRSATQRMGFMRAITINGQKVSVTGLNDVRPTD